MIRFIDVKPFFLHFFHSFYSCYVFYVFNIFFSVLVILIKIRSLKFKIPPRTSRSTFKATEMNWWAILIVHCVSKNIRDILNCNLNASYQILIIFGVNILGTTCHKWLFSFSPHSTFVSALSGETTTSEISLFYLMRYDCLISATHKNIFFTFLTLWLTFHPVVYFSTVCNKIAWGVGPLCEHRQGDTFSIYWQQYR